MGKNYKEGLTVIVPVHNTEKYLVKCLDSILRQTYKDIFVICIDSSTDGCGNILIQYQNKYANLTVLYDDNTSYGYKINKGIENARTKWIGIVDSDDWIDPSMYEKLLKHAENNSLDICKSDYSDMICNEGNQYEENEYCNIASNAYLYETVFSVHDFPETICESRTAIWTGVYRLQFLNDNRIRMNESEGASFQDTGFFLQTQLLANRIMYYHESLYRYRIDNMNSSVKDSSKNLLIVSEFDWFEKMILPKNKLKEQEIYYYISKKIKTYLWNAQRLSGKAQKEFMLAIRDEMNDLLEKKMYKNITANYIYDFVELLGKYVNISDS